jgi:hypothetical protein
MTRIVDAPNGGRYVERKLGGGVVERTWLEPVDAVRLGGEAILVDRGARERGHASDLEPGDTLSRGAARHSTAGTAPTRVHLVQGSYETIDKQILARSDGREHGMWLQGDLSTGRVWDAVDDGSWQRFRDSLVVDTLEAHKHASVIGHLHIHAAGCVASPADRQVWQRWREALDLPAFVGMIAAVDAADPTVSPRLAAYTVTRGGCQPTGLIIQGRT